MKTVTLSISIFYPYSRMQTIAKTSFRAAVVALVGGLVYLTACERTESNPQSTTATKTITSQGGSITAADNQVTVTLPAGAVSASTEVSIEQTGEVAPKGIGNVYKITPEGTTFGKPVTISFKYTEADAQKVNPALMTVAYKRVDGSWERTSSITIDEKNKTVSVQTNHFSDWTLIQIGEGISFEAEGFALEDTLTDLAQEQVLYLNDNEELVNDTATVIYAQNRNLQLEAYFPSKIKKEDYGPGVYAALKILKFKLNTNNNHIVHNTTTITNNPSSVQLRYQIINKYNVGTFQIPVLITTLPDTTLMRPAVLRASFRLWNQQ